MNTKKLKQLVLDLAIHGKLVPQDPNDEPASELLKRIQEEKAKTAKGKKTSISSDNLDEVPFEVPSGWVWTRFGIISNVVRGGSPRPAGSELYYNGPIPFMKVADITKDDGIYVYSAQSSIKESGLKKTRYVDIDTLVISNSGATLGVPKITKFKTTMNDGVAAFEDLSNEIKLFCYWFLKSQTQILRNIDQGAAQPNLNTDLIKGMWIPLPPLSEQKRIVSAIEKWFTVINQIESNEADLRKSIEQTKKKVLDLAIHGKLVEQDENDEPASELLKRIKEEKAKTAKSKKAIADVEIDEVPFELPKGWVWTKFKTICSKLVDGDHNPPTGEKTVTPFIMASSKNINNNNLVDLDDVRFLTEDHFIECDKRTKISIGDIAITTVGTLGRTCIIKENLNLTFQRSVTVVSLLNVSNYYIKYCIDSPYIQNFMQENSRGTAQQGFYINQMEDLLIPLPPLAEQKRIVAKVEEVMGELDKMMEMMI